MHKDLAVNGGFENGSANWQVWPGSNFTTYQSGVTGNDPYQGSKFAATNTQQSGGGIYQDIPLTVNPGDTFCASSEVVTQGSGGGAGGSFYLFLDGGTTESGSQSFSNLPGGDNWLPEQMCVTATMAHSSLRVQFYPTPNTPTLLMDAVDVHYSTPPPAPYTVFDEGLAANWQDWSWCSSNNFTDTSHPNTGSKDISWTETCQWGGLSLDQPGGFAINAYSTLTFALQASQANDNIQVTCFDSAGNDSSFIHLANYGGNPVVGQYTTYTIPLAAFQTTTTITGIVIQDLTGDTSDPPMYVDSIKFQ